MWDNPKAVRRNPCYKCEDRVPGCHSNCNKYLEWRKKYESERELINSNKRSTYKVRHNYHKR